MTALGPLRLGTCLAVLGGGALLWVWRHQQRDVATGGVAETRRDVRSLLAEGGLWLALGGLVLIGLDMLQ